jgi:hypothetical protein
VFSIVPGIVELPRPTGLIRAKSESVCKFLT